MKLNHIYLSSSIGISACLLKNLLKPIVRLYLPPCMHRSLWLCCINNDMEMYRLSTSWCDVLLVGFVLSTSSCGSNWASTLFTFDKNGLWRYQPGYFRSKIFTLCWLQWALSSLMVWWIGDWSLEDWNVAEIDQFICRKSVQTDVCSSQFLSLGPSIPRALL